MSAIQDSIIDWFKNGFTGSAAHSHIKATDIVPPEEDIRTGWFFGNEDTNAAAFTSTVEQTSVPVDISEMSQSQRSIVIECEDASPSYTYKIEFSRNLIDWYQVGTETGIADEFYPVPAAQFLGFDKYARLKITATGSGDQLLFKSYAQARVGV